MTVNSVRYSKSYSAQAIGTFLGMLLVGHSLNAQQPQIAQNQFSAPTTQAALSAPPAEKPSIFIKLDRFQKSVKQKMKNTFSRNTEADNAASTSRPAGKQALATSLYGNSGAPSSPTAFQGQQQQFQTIPNQQYATQQYANQQVQAQQANQQSTSQVDLANYQLPGPNQTAPAQTNNGQYRVNAPLRGNGTQPMQQPIPPNGMTAYPSADYPAPQTQQNMNGAPNGSLPGANEFGGQQSNAPINMPPTSYGVQLGGQQITATEHALRLKEENEKLTADRESLIARNMRLQRELEASKTMIGKLNAALSEAEKSLDDADSTNRALRQELSSLRAEHQRSLLATDRMLDSLRAELDDMLMREITIEP